METAVSRMDFSNGDDEREIWPKDDSFVTITDMKGDNLSGGHLLVGRSS
jgi:hypothetical protein